MVELKLLGGDLDQETLAEVAGGDAGGVKMLDEVDGAADEVEGGLGVEHLAVRLALGLAGFAQGSGEFVVGGGKVAVSVKIADYIFGCLMQWGSRVRAPSCHAR